MDRLRWVPRIRTLQATEIKIHWAINNSGGMVQGLKIYVNSVYSTL